jgi:mannan endo-1,4-beta-mannosidase
MNGKHMKQKITQKLKTILPVLAATMSMQVSTGHGHTVNPVNSNADDTTKAIYNWLVHLPNRSENRVLSGAFGGYTNIGGEDVFSTQETDDIYNATSPAQRPAIYACDYAQGWSVSGAIANLVDYSCNNALITHWQQGGLVQISNHLPNPVAVHRWGEDGGLTPNCSANYVISVNPADAGKQYGMQDTDGLQDTSETNGVKLFKNKCRIQPTSSSHQWGLAANGSPNCSYDYQTLNPNDTGDNWGYQDTDSNGSGNSCYFQSVNASGQGGGLKVQISDAQYSQILDRTTPVGIRWKNTMDKVAAGLQQLKDSGVTVIYRPLHEMNGEWFWWGPQDRNNVSQARKELYKNLYRDMYDYFTTTKNLNNLIWVYSPDAGPGNKSAFYPGANYVDIVGLDAYNDDPTQISGYSEMLAFNKPFAFAEVGPRTAAAKDSNGNYIQGNFNYQNFINKVQSNFPKAIYYIPWNAGWSPLNNNKNNNISGLFNHSWSLNKGEIWSGASLSTIVEAASVLFDFENGVQAWDASNQAGGPWAVTDWASSGNKSIKVDLALSAGAGYSVRLQQNQNFLNKQNLSLDLKLASWGNVGSGIVAKLYVKSGSSWTWHDGGAVTVSSGQQKSLSINLSNVTNLSQIKEIGVYLYLPSGSGQTSVYVDNVQLN